MNKIMGPWRLSGKMRSPILVLALAPMVHAWLAPMSVDNAAARTATNIFWSLQNRGIRSCTLGTDVEIREASEGKGRGIFAMRPLPAGTFLCRCIQSSHALPIVSSAVRQLACPFLLPGTRVIFERPLTINSAARPGQSLRTPPASAPIGSSMQTSLRIVDGRTS